MKSKLLLTIGCTGLAIGIGLVGYALVNRAQAPAGQVIEPQAASRLQLRSPSSEKQSVLLITIDTTRADRLEPYGVQNVATPVMQSVASRGITFANAIAVSPITLVSHTSILTGTYPFEHGVRNNGIHHVSDDTFTLAEAFKQEGYTTAAFISAAVLDERYGLSQGFDVYDDDLSERRNISPRMVADRPAENTVAAANAYLDNLADDQPYFVWVHLYDPHASYSPPAPYRDEYRERLYDGEIAYMDEQIGALLRHPRVLAGNRKPIVSIIADHGESLGEHGERTHALLAYDSTLHIPWLLHIPDGPAGVRINETVGQTDLMPTLLDLVGIDFETPSGRSLVPTIEGNGAASVQAYYSETYLPYYTYGWSKLKVLRKGRWKWIEAPTPELYDLMRDPKELTDLSDREQGIAHDMQRDLAEWTSAAAENEESTLALDGEELARLRSLGYLSVGTSGIRADSDRPNPMEMISYHVGLERARALLADRLYSAAAYQLETVLRRDPGNLAALVDLIRAREGEGRIDEAIELGQRALEIDPDYTQTYLMLARLEAQKDNIPGALELLDLAGGKDPSTPEVPILKATFLHRTGEFNALEDVLENALQRHPDHPRLNAVYAHLVEGRKGDMEAAETRLRQSLTADPYQDQAWLFLGRVLERRQDYSGAGEAYRAGLKSQPDNAELHGALGHLYARQGDPAQAEVELREAIRLSPTERSELRVSLGAVLAEMDRNEEARAEYDRVLATDRDHPGARNNAAIAMYRMGKVEEARLELARIIDEFPRHADAYNNLAAIAVDQQDWDLAIDYSRRTLDIAPNLVEGWNNLAIGLEETGDLDNAIETYERALEIAPDYWPALYNLAALSARQGRVDFAEESFATVLRHVPNHAESHLQLGFLYADSLADPARAKRHWNAYLKHASAHPRRDEVLQRIQSL